MSYSKNRNAWLTCYPPFLSKVIRVILNPSWTDITEST